MRLTRVVQRIPVCGKSIMIPAMLRAKIRSSASGSLAMLCSIEFMLLQFSAEVSVMSWIDKL